MSRKTGVFFAIYLNGKVIPKFKKGYLGAKKLSRREIAEYKSKINIISEGKSKLIILPEDDKFLKGCKAPCHAFTGNPYVQKGMTEYEVFHEFKHFEEFIKLAKHEYLKGAKDISGDLNLDLIRTYKREKYVFDGIIKNKAKFSDVQLKDAQRHINEIVQDCIDSGIDVTKINYEYKRTSN